MTASTVPVQEVRFDRAILAAMPEDERRLMIIMGDVTNDLMAAHRLLIYCNNFSTKDHLFHVAGLCQSLVMVRFLIGMLHEVWAVVDREVLRSPALGPRYHEAMQRDWPKQRGDLDRLRRYFGSGESKHVRRIRNDFAFHYLTHKWDLSHWEKVPDAGLVFHVSQRRVNSFYEFSHEAVTWAMLAEVDEDPGKAFDKVYGEVTDVAGWLLEVVHAIMYINLGTLTTDGKLPIHKQRYVRASNPYAVRVPCFVNDKVKSD